MKIRILILLTLIIQSCTKNVRTGDLYWRINKSEYNLKTLQFDHTITRIDTTNSLEKLLYNLEIIIGDNGRSNLTDIEMLLLNSNEKNLTSEEEKVIYYLTNGYKNSFLFNSRINGILPLNKAHKLSQTSNNKSLKRLCLRALLLFYDRGSLQNDQTYNQYLEEYKKLCEDQYDHLYYYSYWFNISSRVEVYNERITSLKGLHDSIFIGYDSLVRTFPKKNEKVLLFYYMDKGNYIIRQNPKKAIEYYKKASELFEDTSFYQHYYYLYYSNLSRASSLLNKHEEGLKYVERAKTYISSNDSIKQSYILSLYEANHYKKLKQYDKAYQLLERASKSSFHNNFQKHNTTIAQTKVRLETVEKEKENLELKQKNAEKRNWIFIISGLVIFGGYVSFQTLRNSKKKRLLALQEKELETQKNLTLLKEQEIVTINAMVEGQEKERKRVAEDLHDNLGSVIATLKLHFENLRINREKKKIDQETLFDKTENLIEEAYQKVRSIAHAKNSGVIANQGLLVAVKLMAEKVSSANSIQIEVIHYGLEKPLENSLEITLFRIIQELTTNIIKHAQASMVTINISQDTEDITILIEDDGIGMDISQVDLKKGMGLHSIKTRVEHLEGSFTIDSTPNKGTTIIINIPT